jgi:hypothetical protein
MLRAADREPVDLELLGEEAADRAHAVARADASGVHLVLDRLGGVAEVLRQRLLALSMAPLTMSMSAFSEVRSLSLMPSQIPPQMSESCGPMRSKRPERTSSATTTIDLMMPHMTSSATRAVSKGRTIAALIVCQPGPAKNEITSANALTIHLNHPCPPNHFATSTKG